MHVKSANGTWPDKFKDLFFKSIIRFQILNIIIELVPHYSAKKTFDNIHV